MKYEISKTTKFKRDYKLAVKRGLDINELERVIMQLADGITLPEKYHDHPLGGNWTGHRECHITPDWLLVYYRADDVLVLTLVRTGTHSDLFKT